MHKKILLAIYDDEILLMNGVKILHSKSIRIKNVFSPFAIHGIDEWLGIKKTRLAITSFLYGATGFSLGLWMLWYMMIHDWPIDIGGKPSFALYQNLPAFIPILFELTVFCAAHLMVLTFFLRSKILPFVAAPVPDCRVTDDRFAMQVIVTDENMNEVKDILKESGALEIKYQG